jgi:DNA-binding Lrp family transcriptional regulator
MQGARLRNGRASSKASYRILTSSNASKLSNRGSNRSVTLIWVNVKLRRRAHTRRDDFEAALRATPEVIEAHRIAGRFDYILKAALPTVSAWDSLRERIDPENEFIKSVDVLPGLRTAKATSPHPLLGSLERS